MPQGHCGTASLCEKKEIVIDKPKWKIQIDRQSRKDTEFDLRYILQMTPPLPTEMDAVGKAPNPLRRCVSS
jgi:hypothetical protein